MASLLRLLAWFVAGAQSLRGFVTHGLELEYNIYRQNHYYAGTAKDYIDDKLDTALKTLNDRVSNSRKMLDEGLRLSDDFYNALNKSGVLSVARGGPPLYSCDFLGDTVLEAVGYLVEIFGRQTVRRVITRDLELEFLEDNECAIRSFVCAMFSCTSKAELSKVIPEAMLHYKDMFSGSFDEVYMAASSRILQVLARPGSYISRAMSYLRLSTVADRVNFPHFPLSLTKTQGKQFAALMDLTQKDDPDMDVEKVGKAMFEADSFGDVEHIHVSVSYMTDILEQIEGKTDAILQLAASVYQLLLSAEEQGLFMLRDNW